MGSPQSECFEGEEEQTTKRPTFAISKLAIGRFVTSHSEGFIPEESTPHLHQSVYLFIHMEKTIKENFT